MHHVMNVLLLLLMITHLCFQCVIHHVMGVLLPLLMTACVCVFSVSSCIGCTDDTANDCMCLCFLNVMHCVKDELLPLLTTACVCGFQRVIHHVMSVLLLILTRPVLHVPLDTL